MNVLTTENQQRFLLLHDLATNDGTVGLSLPQSSYL